MQEVNERLAYVTVVQNTLSGGRLGKTHRYDETTNKVVTRTEAYLSEGSGRRVGVASIGELIALRSALGPNEALMMGVTSDPEVRIVTQAALARLTAEQRHDNHVVARDRAHVSWPEGAAVFMLDLDHPDEWPPEIRARAPSTPEAWRQLLIEIVPGLGQAPVAWTVSSSSCLFLYGKEIAGVRGQRFYILIDAGQMIPLVGATLRNALIQRGLVWYAVSKSGSLLERYPFDFSVLVPEHLDFAAAPECVPPLTWQPPAAVLWNNDCPPLISSDFPSMTEDDRRRIDATLRELRRAKQDEAQARRKVWIEETGQKIALHAQVGPAVGQEVAAAAIEANLLLSGFLLCDSDDQTVSVGELLQEPAKHNGRRFHDPIEPDYRGDGRIAVFLVTDGDPVIYSHAHGGQTWRCLKSRPTVRVDLIEPAVTQTSRALERDHCGVYRSGSELIRINEAEARMQVLDAEGLGLMLQRRFRFIKRRRDGDALADVPPRILRALQSEGPYLPVPALAAVVRGPFALRDGTIVDEPGYDAASQVTYISVSPCPPKVRRHITLGEAREALRRLWYPVHRFPFKTAMDRGVALAALITAVVRPSIGISPGYGITANTAGTGKTLLAQVIGALQTGKSIASSPLPRDDEEIRKHLFAALRQGDSFLLLDNAARGTALDSPALANLITAPVVDGRVLGLSRTEQRVNRLTVVITGNNLTLVGDLNRRILPVGLDAVTERPWEREFSFHPVNHVLANWLPLRVAALESVQAWRLQGAPRAPGSSAFPDWDGMVRSVVVWAAKTLDIGVELADPIEAIRASYANDPETELLGALLGAVCEQFGEHEFQLKDIEDVLQTNGELFNPLGLVGTAQEPPTVARLREAHAAVLESLRHLGRRDSTATLGIYLDRHAGRIVGGLKFVKGGKLGGARRWRVVRVENSVVPSPTEVGVA